MHHHQYPWPKLPPSILTELKYSIIVSFVLLAGMCYVRFATIHIPPGFRRFIALLPVISLLPVLPAAFSFIHLRTIATFFLSWLALFKLLLLSIGKGPLDPSQSFLVFFFTATLPVKFQLGHRKTSLISISEVPLLSLKTLVLICNIYLYRYHPLYGMYTLLSLYTCHLYLGLELAVTLTGTIASIIINMPIEPQFNNPFLGTSLRDFWSRRWNIMVSQTLRQLVYDPVAPRLGPAIGLIACFLVSGLMHEVIFYYLASTRPTGEVVSFFLLQGLGIIVEHIVKRATTWRPPKIIACPMTIGFVMISAFWLVFDPLLRTGANERVLEECMGVITFLEDVARAVLSKIRN
ncbi:MBOAT (membrane bound O-acyl transferase) family protein [Rhynchospora pubera]|uniref:MBOAT (Membrane bound O-acyl transferase) family protein n=2 Tax=Rhynchospora pubera TaxID=906938 RepID=A0AAV8GBP7_9POAL|nr:MBOAT (membrane bound O-acyl transferase) family protein [Rhynchospora pubera]